MFNAYGGNVYKKYQVNMGNPYPVNQKKTASVAVNREPEDTAEIKGEEILEEARKQAELILQQATREAEEMLVKAQEKITAHMLEVEQQAKEEGYRNGEKMAQNHYQGLIQEAEEMRREAGELYHNAVLSLEGQMVETILDIGRKVIGMELSQNREAIINLIRTSLQSTNPSGEILVTVSPEDYEIVLENQEKLAEGIKNLREFNIKKDNSLQRGGCIVETGFGSVDSSVETQMKAIEDAFREIIGTPEGFGEAAASGENVG